MTRPVLAAVAVALLGACATPPPTVPPVDVPAGWRSPAATDRSLADLRWEGIALTAELQALIREALAANADLLIAADRVELARAQFGLERSFLFPNAGGTVYGTRQRTPVPGSEDNVVNSSAAAGFALSTWEIDLWGRVRAATEGARRSLLATEETRRALYTSIVAQVSSAYLVLLELDEQLRIARNTLQTRQESLRLIEARFRGGIASRLDVNDAITLVAGAQATIADLERRRTRTENGLCVLIGRNPGPIARASRLDELQLPAQLPAGLPSGLLARRPDILAAEQGLAATEANVDAARKAFFPAITLTGLLGFASPALRELFDSGRYAWQVSPAVTIPIFNAGRLASNLDAREAERSIATEQYKLAVRAAFKDVDDALSDYQRYGEERVALATAVTANRERLRLSGLRYKAGVASYFEVLDSSRQLFDAELRLVQGLRAQYTAVVELYQALGGGWDPAAATPGLPASPYDPRRPGAWWP